VALHETGGLDEHAARSARRVVNAAMIRLDDLNDQLDDAGGREELAAFLPFRHRELSEEVFVDLPEGVAFDIHGNGGEVFQKRNQQFLIETVVGSWENVLQVLVVGFDCPHCLIDRLADISPFRKLEQVREPGVLWEV
jgi:hypothetical protein